jgi:hypothetical protein
VGVLKHERGPCQGSSTKTLTPCGAFSHSAIMEKFLLLGVLLICFLLKTASWNIGAEAVSIQAQMQTLLLDPVPGNYQALFIITDGPPTVTQTVLPSLTAEVRIITCVVCPSPRRFSLASSRCTRR